jgi:uncharacterized protein
MASLNARIADELGVPERQVSAAVGLLDGGATVPFVARYRKEATGGLDDAQLRTLQERLSYLRALEERRTAILNSKQACPTRPRPSTVPAPSWWSASPRMLT